MRRILTAIARDETGATIVEFALVLPVLALVLIGIFDVGFNMYAGAVLRGVMNEAGRDSTIEAATTGSIDKQVRDAVQDIVPGATVTFTRRAYSSFTDVKRAEDYTDVNGDGTCNNGEPFEDANTNGVYDTDRGIDGQGGARDAVLYTATMSYKRMFPLAGFAGVSDTYELSSATVLRNQPYDNTLAGAPPVGNCP
ncbi:TadE/TadG family type IV pilus assembly protein [Alteriqipengyuania sp. WL0013]|uniref:TadE/TadG family type IV pilus assembly protein n=1 Tax=Alteriqipengyuania sp. WL0013 TaxID=3110773 RepID=UPI002CCCC1B0|nr:TadE/TadG family type IV pilus assembly protein [Alteriqipengyuania sp. WL0013]MEB3414864.1 TadE/TadG family type IV pilus assembly protein [Alteriqipengyuania sp. WL0013]